MKRASASRLYCFPVIVDVEKCQARDADYARQDSGGYEPEQPQTGIVYLNEWPVSA